MGALEEGQGVSPGRVTAWKEGSAGALPRSVRAEGKSRGGFAGKGPAPQRDHLCPALTDVMFDVRKERTCVLS